VGKRHKNHCGNICSKNGSIPWSLEARYLGIYLVAGNNSYNFDEVKAKLDISSNSILAKLGKQRNPAVALKLIASTAIPVLTYSLEALELNKTQRLSLDHPWERAFMKIYKTFDKEIVHQCQFFNGFLPLSHTIDTRQTEFLRTLPYNNNNLLKFFFDLSAHK